MKKREFSYDEIVVGLILKFGSVDVFDISVLIDMIGIKDFSCYNESDIFKYIEKNDEDRFEFNMKVVKRNYECIDDFNAVIYGFVNNNLKKCLNDMDLFEFVLRKIKRIDMAKENDSAHNFSDLQKFVIDELKRLGYIVNGFNKLGNNFDYGNLKLSKKGFLYLFLIDNSKIINRFTKLLRDNGYNDRLLEIFLIAQDLNNDIKYVEEKVFTIDCFCQFCDVYDINPYVENVAVCVEDIGYSRRKCLDN